MEDTDFRAAGREEIGKKCHVAIVQLKDGRSSDHGDGAGGRRKLMESSRCGSVERSLAGVHGDSGSNLGLAQWVGDLALLWTVVWVTDMAWICCFCAVAWASSCGSGSTPSLEPPYAGGGAQKRPKKKRRRRRRKRRRK